MIKLIAKNWWTGEVDAMQAIANASPNSVNVSMFVILIWLKKYEYYQCGSVYLDC